MNRHTLFRRSLITAAVAAMAACTSPIETPVEPVKPGTHAGVLPGTHAVETPAKSSATTSGIKAYSKP